MQALRIPIRNPEHALGLVRWYLTEIFQSVVVSGHQRHVLSPVSVGFWAKNHNQFHYFLARTSNDKLITYVNNARQDCGLDAGKAIFQIDELVRNVILDANVLRRMEQVRPTLLDVSNHTTVANGYQNQPRWTPHPLQAQGGYS